MAPDLSVHTYIHTLPLYNVDFRTKEMPLSESIHALSCQYVNLLPFTSWKPNPNPTHVWWYLFCADSPLAHLVVALSAT